MNSIIKKYKVRPMELTEEDKAAIVDQMKLIKLRTQQLLEVSQKEIAGIEVRAFVDDQTFLATAQCFAAVLLAMAPDEVIDVERYEKDNKAKYDIGRAYIGNWMYVVVMYGEELDTYFEEVELDTYFEEVKDE